MNGIENSLDTYTEQLSDSLQGQPFCLKLPASESLLVCEAASFLSQSLFGLRGMLLSSTPSAYSFSGFRVLLPPA